MVVFMIKVISIISLLTSSSWTHSIFVRRFRFRAGEDTEENRATMRRLVEAADEEEYQDEPADRDTRDQGPRVEISRLMEHQEAGSE
jgi:hypothetical protein